MDYPHKWRGVKEPTATVGPWELRPARTWVLSGITGGTAQNIEAGRRIWVRLHWRAGQRRLSKVCRGLLLTPALLALWAYCHCQQHYRPQVFVLKECEVFPSAFVWHLYKPHIISPHVCCFQKLKAVVCMLQSKRVLFLQPLLLLHCLA